MYNFCVHFLPLGEYKCKLDYNLRAFFCEEKYRQRSGLWGKITNTSCDFFLMCQILEGIMRNSLWITWHYCDCTFYLYSSKWISTIILNVYFQILEVIPKNPLWITWCRWWDRTTLTARWPWWITWLYCDCAFFVILEVNISTNIECLLSVCNSFHMAVLANCSEMATCL